MFDTGLANRIRAKGVEVVEVGGWQTRGSSSFSPQGSVNHHTAGSGNGATPSLNVCIYGRGGPHPVPGPLCNVLQSREPSGWDKAYVIAAGRANHAGEGGWRGLTGNSSVHGLEVEHVGTTGVSSNRVEVSARIQAAFLEGSTRDARLTCQHFEWAPDRKIDFNVLGMGPDQFRSRVNYWIGRSYNEPASTPIELEKDMDYVVQCSGRPAAVIIGGRFIKVKDGKTVEAFKKAKDMQFIQFSLIEDFDALDRGLNITKVEER